MTGVGISEGSLGGWVGVVSSMGVAVKKYAGQVMEVLAAVCFRAQIGTFDSVG